MPDTFVLRNLHDQLVEDEWRVANPFSDEMGLVHQYLFNPFATTEKIRNVLAYWIQRHQPCLFGSVAAASDSIHYCLIGEDDIQRKSDSEIQSQIHDARLEWRRRATRPDVSSVAHSFVLLAYSPRLARAAPDNRLNSFARQIRELWGCPNTVEAHGIVHWEHIYLSNPEQTEFRRFEVPVDFFAAQGDGRWWHDHRAPGGILFTANSVGHMRLYREWYQNKQDQQEWTVATAMQTISRAVPTSYGRATWLREIETGGKPTVPTVPCPFANAANLKPEIRSKDWTKYFGYLHTDHSIRSEFFRLDADIDDEIRSREFIEDFTYLYDQGSADYERLISGKTAIQFEIDLDIGSIVDWHRRYRAVNRIAAMKKFIGYLSNSFRRKNTAQATAEVVLEELYEEIESWHLSPRELNNITE